MTRKYWIGILAGMLGVFVFGMLIARGVDKGKAAIQRTFPAALNLLNADFRVDSHHLGDVERVQMMRSTPGMVDSIVLTVKADSTDEDVQALFASTCRLRLISAQPIDSHTRFACTSDRDSARLDLVRFGHVILMPQDKSVVLYVNADNAPDVRQKAYRGYGAGDSGEIDILAADDTFAITINGRELVRASGDEKNGGFVLRGANGKPIIEINGADSNGSVKVTGANGKPLINTHGTTRKDTIHH